MSTGSPRAPLPLAALQPPVSSDSALKVVSLCDNCILKIGCQPQNLCDACQQRVDTIRKAGSIAGKTISGGSPPSSPTSSSTHVDSCSSSSPAATAPNPPLVVKPNPTLHSSQLGDSSFPPFVTLQSSRAFIIRMMHLWVATAGTWCLEKGWNWAVENLDGEDWLKLTPTHTTLWMAIAASTYLVATHICNWQFPSPNDHTRPTRLFLKTLKVLTCAHVAAAITCYFKIWINPIKGLTCLGVTFALPYSKIEHWGGLPINVQRQKERN